MRFVFVFITAKDAVEALRVLKVVLFGLLKGPVQRFALPGEAIRVEQTRSLINRTCVQRLHLLHLVHIITL